MQVDQYDVKRKYIEELIYRINTEVKNNSSSTAVSWKALREAKTLADISFYPILKELLLGHSKPKDKKYRNAAYFIFGELLKNAPEEKYILFYLEQLEKENDKYILSSMLDKIGDILIPTNISIKNIITLTRSEQWQVRHSAIYALQAAATAESKQALVYYINQIDVKTYKYEIIYANAALGAIGSLEDIPILQQHMKSRFLDVRESAKFAISRIQNREKEK